MKAITKTPDIIDLIRKSAGQDANVENLVVYEAIALNTLPLRKEHPLFKGARVQRHILLEMAARVERESVPLQIMHDKTALPVGRVFHASVLDKTGDSELRALFFVDAGETDLVRKIEAGVIDQVSVSITPKQILCSACDFDFMGDESTLDHVMDGCCGQGHRLGLTAHPVLVGLDRFFELSLVNVGGAQNARIVGNDNSLFGAAIQRLAASGADPNHFVLNASLESRTRKMEVDLSQFITELADTRVELAATKTIKATLEAKMAELDAQVTTLTKQLVDAGDAATTLAAKDEELATVNAQLATAEAALKTVATKVLTAAGEMKPELPAGVEALSTLIEEKATALSLALTAGGKGSPAVDDAKKTQYPADVSVYRTLR